MKRSALLVWALGAAFACAAQQTQQIFSIDSAAVPGMTVVPVQKPPVQVVDYSTVDEESLKGLDRKERRALRERRFAERIDSIVQSRNYVFYPNSMQQLPNGASGLIYAGYYYLGIFADHVEVHLPTERGISQYVEMLNFDTMTIRDYHAARTQWGWNITFRIADDEVCYGINLLVSTVTGESVLVLMTPSVTMKYIGWLWREKPAHAR